MSRDPPIFERRCRIDEIEDTEENKELRNILRYKVWGNWFDNFDTGYGDLVKIFYKKCSCFDEHFTTRVGNQEIKVDRELISRITGCPLEFRFELPKPGEGPTNSEIWNCFYPAAWEMPKCMKPYGQFYLIKSPPTGTDDKSEVACCAKITVLGKLVAANYFGIRGDSNPWPRDIALVVYYIVCGKQVDLCGLIIKRMIEISEDAKYKYAFPCLITRICQHFGIDTNIYKSSKLNSPPEAISSRTINRSIGTKKTADKKRAKLSIPKETTGADIPPGEEDIVHSEVIVDGEVSGQWNRSLNLHRPIAKGSTNLKSPKGMKKVLLILDLNNILGDFSYNVRMQKKGYLLRPHHQDFLRFCFKNFPYVLFWTSMDKKNMKTALEDLKVGEIIKEPECKSSDYRAWCKDNCIQTDIMYHPGKKVMLKAFGSVINAFPDLEINDTNVLMVDDSPYKSILNPRYTSVFPEPYDPLNHKDDALGPKGDIRKFLDGVPESGGIQNYVRYHQPPSFQNVDPTMDPIWKNIENQEMMWEKCRELYKFGGTPDYMMSWVENGRKSS